MSESTAADGLLLNLRGIHKRFPGVHALRGVDLDVRRGEVHAVVGENGAGKSTLMQILAGVYQADAGRIDFDGRKDVVIADERSAQELGIVLVYQERSLFGPMSVAENIFRPGSLFSAGAALTSPLSTRGHGIFCKRSAWTWIPALLSRAYPQPSNNWWRSPKPYRLSRS